MDYDDDPEPTFRTNVPIVRQTDYEVFMGHQAICSWDERGDEWQPDGVKKSSKVSQPAVTANTSDELHAWSKRWGCNVRTCHDTVIEYQQPPYQSIDLKSKWLYEGNLEEWLQQLLPHVEKIRQTNDLHITRAILSRVWRDFLRRQPLPAEDCRTVSDLLKQLKKGCQPFRFLDLPIELRDRIYEMTFGKHTRRRQNFHDWLHGTTSRVLALDKVEYNPSRTKSPSLLSVNHQVRAEAGKVYYEHHKFEMFIDTGRSHRPLEEINLWSRVVLRELATHLRDLRVHINWIGHCYQFETTLHVRITRGKGLEATGSRAAFHLENESYEEEPNDFAGLPEYAADCEAKRIDRGQMGEAVVGFFLEDKAGLRKACFGPRVEEIDGEGLWTDDEPDAANNYEW